MAVVGLALEVYSDLVMNGNVTDGDEEVEAGSGGERSVFMLAVMTGGMLA